MAPTGKLRGLLVTNSANLTVTCEGLEELWAIETGTRGHKSGRPPIRPDDRRIVLANKLFQDKSISLDGICTSSPGIGSMSGTTIDCTVLTCRSGLIVIPRLFPS